MAATSAVPTRPILKRLPILKTLFQNRASSIEYQLGRQSVDHRYQKRNSTGTEYVGYLDERDILILAVSQKPPEKTA